MTDDEIRDLFAALNAKVAALLKLVGDQRSRKEWYTTGELAQELGRDPYTVRNWARLGRIHAVKRPTGRGRTLDWAIGHEELERIRNEGLLPLRPAGVGP